MSDKNLITKARLEQIKAAETELVDNLSEHANDSLSKAHGIELYRLPHPFLDGYGNDISVYMDSHGDRMGYSIMRLTYNFVNYYAPLESTALPGKDPLTGISRNTGVFVNTDVLAPGGTAWTTDFTPEDEQDIITTNQSVMLPHTQLAHWETHGGGIYQVIPQILYDSAGHRICNYVARLLVDGVELWIPCDSRLGGPVQPVRVVFNAINTLQNTNCNWCWMGRDDTQYGYFWYRNATGGTLPASFVWQYNDRPFTSLNDPLLGTGMWWDMPYSGAYTSMTNNFKTTEYKWEAGNKLNIRSHVGSDSGYYVALIRGKWTNPAGVVTTNWCVMGANDEDGSWIFSDPDVNQSAQHKTITNDPTWGDGYYYPPGPPV